MADIVTAKIDTIATNPYRKLHAYPYIKSKIEALQRSIAEVGLWPSVIARPLSDKLWKYEMAFGHHRIEAARRSGLIEVPLIVEKLSDARMLQYMGRENLEDYNAVFLIQLESWEAATKSGLADATGKSHQAIEVAKILGWVDVHSKDGHLQLNQTAMACNAAYSLIEGGYMAREAFVDLSVSAARHIAERALTRIEQIDKVGANSKRPAKDIAAAKQHVARGAKATADQVRKGTVPNRDIRSSVDFHAGVSAARAAKPSPLFAVFANAVAENIRRTIQTDADADKLVEIEKVLRNISMLEDWEALRRLDVELINLARRAESWQKRLIPPKDKIVHFRALENRGG